MKTLKFELLIAPWRPLKKGRDVVFMTLLLTIGALIAITLTQPWRSPAAGFERIAVAGSQVAPSEIAKDQLLRLVRAKLQAPVHLDGLEDLPALTWSTLGAKVDMQLLDRLIADLGRGGSAAARYYRRKSDDPVPSVDLPVYLDAKEAVEAVLGLKESTDRPAQNARFDFLQGGIRPERPGRSIDLYSTLERLERSLDSGENAIEPAIEYTTPQVNAGDLARIETDEILGFFETRYSRLPKDRDRTHNVLLGASRLDGQVILPGATFSFNDTLGDRTQARGFRYAPVLAGGMVVEGMGGGTCQVASTLYAASFFAGLIVHDRRPHSRPSSYIKLGLDATVSYPDKNLVIQNPFNFPVVIHFTSEDGELRVEIRGQMRPYTVTFLRRIVGTEPFPEKYKDDPKLEVGTRVTTQKGIPGYTVQRYQILEQGKIGYRHRTEDKYPPTTQVVHRGTAPQGSLGEDVSSPREDPHKPYRASKRLRMVQGPDDLWHESSHD